jgi:hypothetical protein
MYAAPRRFLFDSSMRNGPANILQRRYLSGIQAK